MTFIAASGCTAEMKCAKYVQFLQTFGTHVVVGLQNGGKAWMSVKTSKSKVETESSEQDALQQRRR